MAVEFELLRTRATSWRPAEARVALNARMDARIVPDSGAAGAPGPGWAGSGGCSGSGGSGAQGPGCLPPGGVAQPAASARPGSSTAGGAGGAGGCSAAGSDQPSGSAGQAAWGCREHGGGCEGPSAHSAGGCGGGPGKGLGSGGAGARLHYAHVVVLDDFVGEVERRALLDLLTAPGWDHTQVRAVACGPSRQRDGVRAERNTLGDVR